MKLTEEQGKKLFQKYKIIVPNGIVVKTNEINLGKMNLGLKELTKQIVVKAQVKSGKRGKAGLIKIINNNKKELQKTVKEFQKKKIQKVLIEEKIPIKKEEYLGILINREKKCYTLIYSEKGGMGIEEIAKKNSKKIIKKDFIYITSVEKELKTELKKELYEIAKKLFKLIKEKDASLVEINPLVKTNQGYVALDSKIVIDENGLFRNQDLEKIWKEQIEGVEKIAQDNGLNYVKLNGDIGVIGNGAGLVMSTIDMIEEFGGKAKNFLDLGGGANKEKMKKAMEIIAKTKPKKILINVYGGITKTDEIARGLVEFIEENKQNDQNGQNKQNKQNEQNKQKTNFNYSKNLVVRITGTNEEITKKILKKAKINNEKSMAGACKKVVVNEK